MPDYARRMYFIYVVNAKKGHLKGADNCSCRLLWVDLFFLQATWANMLLGPTESWGTLMMRASRIRIRNGSAFLKMAGSGSGTAKKKCGSTTLVCVITTTQWLFWGEAIKACWLIPSVSWCVVSRGEAIKACWRDPWTLCNGRCGCMAFHVCSGSVGVWHFPCVSVDAV